MLKITEQMKYDYDKEGFQIKTWLNEVGTPEKIIIKDTRDGVVELDGKQLKEVFIIAIKRGFVALDDLSDDYKIE